MHLSYWRWVGEEREGGVRAGLVALGYGFAHAHADGEQVGLDAGREGRRVRICRSDWGKVRDGIRRHGRYSAGGLNEVGCDAGLRPGIRALRLVV